VLKLLSCVARMERHAGKSGFSVDLVAKTVTGSRDKKVTKWGFEALPTHGILGPRKGDGGRSFTVGEVADVVEVLVGAECLTAEHVTREIARKERTYKVIAVAERGWRVMRRQEPELKLAMPHARKMARGAAAPEASRDGIPGDLVACLRDVRTQLCTTGGVPAYVVAPNKTLDDMARLRPTTKTTMLAVHGMGPARYQRYGKPFLAAIREWVAER